MNWTPELLNSTHLKKELMSHLMWRLHFHVVIDEYRFMDVFGIRRSEYMVEFEIKISKADLMREIRCIKMEDCQKYGKDWEKFIKHKFYLTGNFPKTDYDLRLESLGVSTNTQDILRPNEFYFYVPDFLGDIAVRETANTPYGVAIIGTTKNSYGREYHSDYEVIKKAIKIHDKKADDKIYRSVAHGLAARNRLMTS